MAHSPAAPNIDIPDFDSYLKERQVVVNDKKKEKKRAGLPWLPNLAAVKGMGVGAQIGAAFASKLGFLAFFGLIGLVAASAGLMQQARLRQEREDYKKKAFNMSLLRNHVLQQNEDMKTRLPPVAGARKDTLGFVYRGDGLDNPSASPDAAAKAAADAAAQADAGKGKDADKSKDAAGADPNALAAQLAAQAQAAQGAAAAPGGAGPNGYSRLSSGFGNMKGGSGMFGGVGRGFDNLNMHNSALGKGDAMRGQQAVGLGSNQLAKGQARNWQAARNVTAGARSSIDANRLRSMQAMMAANRSGDATKAAATNTSAWDAAAAPGQSIQGAGASVPGAGPSPSAPNIGSSQAEGGPTDVTGGSNPDTNAATVPSIPAYQDAVPYQWAITLAKVLMLGIVLLSAFIMIAKATSMFDGGSTLATLTHIVAAMGGMLAALGLYMMSMQQYAQGALWTGIGAMVAIFALASPAAVTSGSLAIAGPYTGMIAAALGGAAGFATQAAAFDGSNNADSKNAYEKQYGVNPDTNQVDAQNKAQFDDQYGKGAADQWNKSHQKFNYTAG